MSKHAIVICPGGAYRLLSPRESEPIARRFAAAGWEPFILNYSVGENLGTRPLEEAARALRRMREKASFVAVCGFSAGGHLAGSLGVHWDDESLFPDAAERAANRPDAMVLSYPVVSSGVSRHAESFRRLTGSEEGGELAEYFSLEKQVTERTPPAFLWHTAEDRSVPVANSLLLAQALWAKRVACELHVFPHGVHGLSLATPEVDEPEADRLADPHVARWMELCIEWLDAEALKKERAL